MPDYYYLIMAIITTVNQIENALKRRNLQFQKFSEFKFYGNNLTSDSRTNTVIFNLFAHAQLIVAKVLKICNEQRGKGY